MSPTSTFKPLNYCLLKKERDTLAYKEINKNNLIKINSVSSFISNIKKLKESTDGTSIELYFRGQEADIWNIEPSIFRDDMLSIEHKLMQIPLQKVPMEFRGFNTMFDIMTKYQHYGMCTRLLDLTTNPLVALYFACKSHDQAEKGVIEKKPCGVVYYTDKFYPTQSTDSEIQIVSALASYDLNKENTLIKILEKLQNDGIIDNKTKERGLTKDYFKEFIKIVQCNYMVMPTYTNERLKKQNGVFLLASLFSFNENDEISKSIISKSKGNLNQCFNETYFYISSENKEDILKELDLYNINEATLFPELEHQLNYIRCVNGDKVKTVEDFNQYEENSATHVKNIYFDDSKLNNYIINNLPKALENVVNPMDIEEITNILKQNFCVDWYRKNSILSKIKMGIMAYYSKKYNDRDQSKEMAKQIMGLLDKEFERFSSSDEGSGD